MQIKYLGKDNFEIKDKKATVYTGEPTRVNDVELAGPGEYEIAGIFIDGLNDGIYIFNLEEMTVAHLGQLSRILTDSEVDKINGVDILMVPVGKDKALSPKLAIEVINQIDPKIVIPMDLGALDEFCKMEGVSLPKEAVFKIAKNDLPQEEERKVIALCPQTKS